MKAIFIFLSIIILFVSCEDVIEVELKDMEPILVIEGVINDVDNQCQILLSKTNNYFGQTPNPKVSEAVITLTDNTGATVNFNETEPGVYLQDIILGNQNTSYTLNVLSEGIEYTANATIPEKVNIDSLSYEYNPESILYEEGWVVSCHFQDPIEFTNFYRLKAYNINDSAKARDSQDIYDDVINNGKIVELPWGYESFQPLDTVVVELYTLDEATYDYYKTLFPISGEGSIMSITTPANPVTNITNNALGYFGAYTISRDTIIINQ